MIYILWMFAAIGLISASAIIGILLGKALCDQWSDPYL